MENIYEKACPQCGNKFIKPLGKSMYDWKKRKYCSRPCADKGNAKIRAERLKQYQYKKGSKPYMTGRKHSEESKEKMRKASLNRYLRGATGNIGKVGEESIIWKGEKAGYSAIHKWLKVYHPKTGKCQHCLAEGKTCWAKLEDKEYTRNIEDYVELCYSCHNNYDKGRLVLIQ